MDKDWSTINVQSDQVFGRDEETRQRLLHHREALTSLIQSAPTEELARRYSDLRSEIQQSIQRIDDQSRAGAGAASSAAASPPDAASARPGSWTNTRPYEPEVGLPATATEAAPQNNRAIILLLVGLVALSAFGLLGWRYLRRQDGGKAGEPAAASTTTESTADSRIVETPHAASTDRAAVAADGLLVTPANLSFGKVRKGTRIVKKFQIANNSSEPLTISAGRSQCHCLWFQFASKVPAGSKVPLSVTLDGARAKKGAVNETITMSSKEHPDEKSTFGVTANVE